MLEIVVKLANDSVGSLATITCLIRKKVDLARDTFTGHSKNAALSGSEKVDGTWLHGVRCNAPAGQLSRPSLCFFVFFLQKYAEI